MANEGFMKSCISGVVYQEFLTPIGYVNVVCSCCCASTVCIMNAQITLFGLKNELIYALEHLDHPVLVAKLRGRTKRISDGRNSHVCPEKVFFFPIT